MLISKKLFKASRPYLFTPMNFLSLENRKPISFNLSYPIALAYSSIRKSRLFESLIVFMLLFLFVFFVENEFILIFLIFFLFFCCPTGHSNLGPESQFFFFKSIYCSMSFFLRHKYSKSAGSSSLVHFFQYLLIRYHKILEVDLCGS